jgi:hypothetical protein
MSSLPEGSALSMPAGGGDNPYLTMLLNRLVFPPFSKTAD